HVSTPAHVTMTPLPPAAPPQPSPLSLHDALPIYYQDIRRERDKESGLIQIAGCVNSQKTHLMYALGDGCEYRVIAFSSEEKAGRSEEHTSELQSRFDLVCRLLLEKKNEQRKQ